MTFRCVLHEVMVLAGHGAEAAHLPEQPLQGVDADARVGGQEAPALFGQVKEDGAGLEDGDRFAAPCRGGVDNGRDAVVGGNAQEVRLELFALADVDGQDAVGQATLFKEEGDLVAVGGGPVIEIDHGV
jgi:hypothetical protein